MCFIVNINKYKWTKCFIFVFHIQSQTIMTKISAKRLHNQNQRFGLHESTENSRAGIIRKFYLDKATIFSVVGLSILVGWVLLSVIYFPELLNKVLPCSVIISCLLIMKSLDSYQYVGGPENFPDDPKNKWI